jgi:hypothetical protein
VFQHAKYTKKNANSFGRVWWLYDTKVEKDGVYSKRKRAGFFLLHV